MLKSGINTLTTDKFIVDILNKNIQNDTVDMFGLEL